MIESRIRQIMDDKGINPYQLSKDTGITYASAHGLYNARARRIDLPVLAKVCEYLDVQVGDLFVYVPSDTARTSEDKRLETGVK